MLTSRFSDDYSYRRPYPTAAARRIEYIPYLGTPEDQIRSAFVGAYGELHDQFQTEEFAGELQDALRHGQGQGVALVDGYLVGAERAFSQPLPSVFQPITAAGAASVVVGQPVIKAKYPRLIGLTRVNRHPRLFSASSNHLAAANALQLDLVVHVTSTQRKKMAQIVGQSFTRGIEPDVTGERLASVVGLFPRWQAAVDNYYMAMLMNGVQHDMAWARAKAYHDQLLDKRGEMISRTEIMRALNDGRLAGWHDLADKGYMDGSTSVKHWNAVPDACPECLDIEPVVGIDSDFDTDHGSIAMPPAHPHCFPAGSVVSGPPVKAGTERWYVGEIVHVSTARHQLSVTPNHPVLTTTGWVAAGQLVPGDQIISQANNDVVPLGQDEGQVPALIEDVARSAGEAVDLTTTTRPVAAADFHGDGQGSEVCVVRTNRLLRNDVEAAFLQQIEEFPFGIRVESASLLTQLRSLHLQVQALDLTPTGSVSRCDVGTTLSRSATGLFKPVGLNESASLNPLFLEETSYDATTDAQPSGDALLRFAGEVTPDEIIDVAVEPFQGWVYNLETTTGWYVTNGVVVHNCHCSVTIDMAAPQEIPTEDVDDAEKQLSDPELARVLDNLPLAS